MLAQPASGRIADVRRIIRAIVDALLAGPRHIRPTLEGVLFVIVTLIVGFAAMNTAAQLLYIMFSLMCGMLVLSAILAKRNYGGIRLTRTAPRLAEAHRPVFVSIEAKNIKTVFPSHGLQVIDRLADGSEIGAVFIERVAANETWRGEYRCLFPARGSYHFDSMLYRTRFPFSFIERVSRRPQAWDILVLPPIADVSHLMQSAAVELGEVEMRRRGRGGGLHNIRPHMRGDSSRDIHWKVSARRGTLMVREYEAEEHRRATIVLDSRISGPLTATAANDFERAVALAASVAAWLAKNGHQFSLRTASGVLAQGGGPSHLERTRKALATLRLVPHSDAAARALGNRAESESRIVIAWHGAPGGSTEDIVVSTSQALAELDAALAGIAEEPAS